MPRPTIGAISSASTFVQLVDYCLTLAGIDRERAMRVLDIGSGGGSSVFAALPAAAARRDRRLGYLAAAPRHACDAGRVPRRAAWARQSLLLSTCTAAFSGPDVFDVVIGAAILHHLLDPRAALTNVAASLKPGGKIILIEPLEAGSLVLTAMYAGVLCVLGKLGQGDGELATIDEGASAGHRNAGWVRRSRNHGPRRSTINGSLTSPTWWSSARQLGLSRVDVYPAQPDLANVYEGAFRSMLVR